MSERRHVAMSARSWWTLGVVAVWLPFLAALAASMWTTPFPVNETVALLEDTRHGTIGAFFDPAGRAWYRPLYFLTWDWLWRGTGSLDRALALFTVIEIAAPLALVLLFIRHLRPSSLFEAAAATCAVAVLVGTPGFRDNLEVPLLMTLVGMPLAMIVWMLLTRAPRLWHGPVIVLLTFIAIGFKEQGLVIAPVVVIAWWTRAPGAGSRLTATIVGLTAMYVAVRLISSGNWPIFEQSMGLGFETLEPNEALARFGAFPYGMYAYSATSTVLNVLFTEPTNGLFSVVKDVVYRQVEPWEILNVVSSMALTATIVWWTTRVIPGWSREGWTPEGRIALVFAVALLASGALSIKYSRDRMGGMAAVFYALAAYEAVCYTAARAAGADGTRNHRFVPTVALLATIALTWHVRAVGTLEWTRRQSELNVIGWLTQVPQREREFAERPLYLGIMSHMIPQGTRPDVSRQSNYPRFVRRLLGPPPE